MNDMSLSIFTIEADSKPLLSFAAKRYQDAEALCLDEQLRTKLASLRSAGAVLCDEGAIFRVRLAHPHEKARYYQLAPGPSAEAELMTVYLVELDRPE
jgi:hypothetical protein